VLKKSFIFWVAGLALYGLGMLSPDFSESKDFKNHFMTMTILYDNNPYDQRLKTAWGFSCLIEFEGKTVLFDTGGDGEILLNNMGVLGKDPRAIEIVILSHIHGDHTGGLRRLLKINQNLKIYIPESFPRNFEQATKDDGTKLIRVKSSFEILPGVWSTGEMGHEIKEQSLLMNTPRGMILVTGCAHPGIIHIMNKAKTIARENIYMVIGGWHLSSAGEKEIKGIMDAFIRIGIQKVAPCHCTGDRAMAMFKDAYGENYIKTGVGSIIKIE
jgi:7,8-dihydropterin-6-yl-methyl-4-(beta-D-ribofuranosyl)aminobenzene 5'-phosphate synthase